MAIHPLCTILTCGFPGPTLYRDWGTPNNRHPMPLLLLACLLLVSCTREPSPPARAQKHLQGIARQHFQDIPIAEDLLPIADYEQWAAGRTQLYRHDRGHVATVPPPPPIDTVLYSVRFPSLTAENLLTRGDIRHFRRQLREGNYPRRLRPHPQLHLLPRAVAYPDEPPYPPHYRLSAPLFNRDYTKALVTVHHCVPGRFKGYHYLFVRRGGRWEGAYSRLYTIE